MVDLQELKAGFAERYGGVPRIFRAPGRVNLIGEHTDYNGGFVLPMAIEREAAVAIAPRSDRQIRAISLNRSEEGVFDLDREVERRQGSWLNYVEGVARILERNGVRLTGADLLVSSSVPTGAGLSSSAALETAVGLALSEISGQTADRKLIALVGQATEHEFAGAKVGIMDQFVSAHAKAGHALLLDCRSLEFEQVPLNTTETAVVICDTMVKHDLATSEYNTRRAECEQGVEILREYLPGIKQLRDVSTADFERYSEHLPDTIRRRCRHVVTEIERTLKAARCLKNNDLEEFGKLMWLSHESLRSDYEVSSPELDVLVRLAREVPGVLGSRMTGGGFGGSTVSLVRRESFGDFADRITQGYQNECSITPSVLMTDAAAGASEVGR